MLKILGENLLQERLRAFSKRSAAWATGFARNYRLDPFFRTEINIILLQVLFSLTVVGLMGATLGLLYQSSLDSIVAHIQEGIINMPIVRGDHFLSVPNFAEVQAKPFFLIVIAGIGIMLAFGYLTVKIALAPTKTALASQKQFVGNVAHELRTPLAILRTNNDVRLMDNDLTPEIRELLTSNTEELQRMSDIINNLLTLNTLIRPEHIEFIKVDMGDVVDEAVKKLTPTMRQKNLTFTETKSEFRMVMGNKTALEQIVVNILKNAIVYTPRGGNIALTLEPDYHGSVAISIKDSGVGIAEKDLFHIFEPYYRGDTSRTRATGGSGLGLAIVSELVRLHRGSVRILSAVGRGTTVIVAIPAAAEASNAKTPLREKAALGEVLVDFSSKKS